MLLLQRVQDLLATYPWEKIDPWLLELPQDTAMGDIALPCFQLAKAFRKSPQQIATEIASDLQPSAHIAKIEAVGPYVNFFVNPAKLAERLCNEIAATGDQRGSHQADRETILVESPSPNTNKPLHLGHIRNMLLGNALCDLLSFVGHDVKRVEVVNDRGIHICKSMLAYQLRGEGAQPDRKSDHFVGDRYVRYAQQAKEDPTLDDQISQMLRDREAGDPEVRALRRTMNDWALIGFKHTYQRFGVQMDKQYFESDHYEKGKQLVIEQADAGLFTRDEKGSIVYDFGADSFGEKVLLRADGTAIYITQDLALAQIRYDDYQMDRMIYVVGNEQEYHFNVLFALLILLGLPFADKCYHMSYGMIELPDGKMKSREGNVVDADTLADEMHAQAAEQLRARYPDLADTELSERAEQIALAAIKFFILKYDSKKDFVFDREESLRFDGESGPYVQYTHARCCSLLAKYEQNEVTPRPSVTPPSTNSGQPLVRGDNQIDYTVLDGDQERILLAFLSRFPDVVAQAADHYEPAVIARWTLELAHLFNSWYHATPVLTDDPQTTSARIALVAGVRQGLANGLRLIGIEAPQVM